MLLMRASAKRPRQKRARHGIPLPRRGTGSRGCPWRGVCFALAMAWLRLLLVLVRARGLRRGARAPIAWLASPTNWARARFNRRARCRAPDSPAEPRGARLPRSAEAGVGAKCIRPPAPVRTPLPGSSAAANHSPQLPPSSQPHANNKTTATMSRRTRRPLQQHAATGMRQRAYGHDARGEVHAAGRLRRRLRRCGWASRPAESACFMHPGKERAPCAVCARGSRRVYSARARVLLGRTICGDGKAW